jgi:hypothetical protein
MFQHLRGGAITLLNPTLYTEPQCNKNIQHTWKNKRERRGVKLDWSFFDYFYIDCEKPQHNTNVEQTHKNKSDKGSVEPNWSVGYV